MFNLDTFLNESILRLNINLCKSFNYLS